MANDFLGNNAGFSVNTALNRGYSIPVSLVVNTANSPVTGGSGFVNNSGAVTATFIFSDSGLACGPSTLVLGNPYIRQNPSGSVGNGAVTYSIIGYTTVSTIYTFSGISLSTSDVYANWTLTLSTGTSYNGNFDLFSNNGYFYSALSNDAIVNVTY